MPFLSLFFSTLTISPEVTVSVLLHEHVGCFCHVKVAWQHTRPCAELLLTHSQFRIHTMQERNEMESLHQWNTWRHCGSLFTNISTRIPPILHAPLQSDFAAPLTKSWSLFPFPLRLDWPVACFDQWNVIKVLLCDFPRSGLNRRCSFCFFCLFGTLRPTRCGKSPARLLETGAKWKRTKVPRLRANNCREPQKQLQRSGGIKNEMRCCKSENCPNNIKWSLSCYTVIPKNLISLKFAHQR